jgi:hypothetical protein
MNPNKPLPNRFEPVSQGLKAFSEPLLIIKQPLLVITEPHFDSAQCRYSVFEFGMVISFRAFE